MDNCKRFELYWHYLGICYTYLKLKVRITAKIIREVLMVIKRDRYLNKLIAKKRMD